MNVIVSTRIGKHERDTPQQPTRVFQHLILSIVNVACRETWSCSITICRPSQTGRPSVATCGATNIRSAFDAP